MKYLLSLSALLLLFFSLDSKAVPIPEEDKETGLRTLECEYCSPWVCDEVCTILGFDGGACNDDWNECRCYIFHKESTTTTRPLLHLRLRAEGSGFDSHSSTDVDDQHAPVIQTN